MEKSGWPERRLKRTILLLMLPQVVMCVDNNAAIVIPRMKSQKQHLSHVSKQETENEIKYI